MQFVVLSDANATDYINRVSVPIFRDAAGGLPAWREMKPDAAKHDTFVFDTAGALVLSWDVGSEQFTEWAADIRAAVEAAN